MKILDDLIYTLNEAAVRNVYQGPFQTAVLTRNCGIAATPHDSHTHHQGDISLSGVRPLFEKSGLEISMMAYSQNPHKAAIGMAAINSLLDIDDEQCVELNAADLLAEKGIDKKVAIIGHFPFISRLRLLAKELWVIEIQPQEEDFPVSETDRIVPQADVVGITGTAFTNHTIDHLLEICNPEAYVVILGGTTPLSPVLFDYGVDAISGTRVIDPEAVLACVSQGATFRQLKGIRLLTMQKGTS